MPGVAQSSDDIGSYISENPFETMIRLGRLNTKNIIYQMPGGNAGNFFITAATTTGDGVLYPLNYSRDSSPGRHFVIVSKETSLVNRDNTFTLCITQNTDPTGQSIALYTDWDRNGEFEPANARTEVDAQNKTTRHTLSVPATAEPGKTRVRVRLEQTAGTSADASVSGGIVYDFVIFVMDGEPRNDCFISVSANNTQLGTASITTPPNEAGRYDKGTNVTVKATVNTHYEYAVTFNGWQQNGQIISTASEYTFNVTESVNLIAIFEAETPQMAEPETSTADNPIWYQIMNAHTDENRKERYIAYDTNTNTTYSTSLRVEKPADTTDKFLWRLEDTGNNRVQIVNKGSGLRIHGQQILETAAFEATTTGSDFAIAPSGHTNGSYSIKYNGNDGYLLNAQDGTWKLVLYNAGIGTGSGWYFYKVKLNEQTTDYNKSEKPVFKASLNNGVLKITGLDDNYKITVVNLTGQLLGMFHTTDTYFEDSIKYPENFVILVAESAKGRQYITKLYDTQI